MILKTYILPVKCPICEGRGIVSGGFYRSIPGADWSGTSVSEQCKQCHGSGILERICVEQVEKIDLGYGEKKN